MINAQLRVGSNKHEVGNLVGYVDGCTLITESYVALAGTFKSQILAADDTYELIAARGNDGILLSDIIISAEKKQSGTITIQFNDGADTETIFLATLTDAPVNMAIPLRGHWLAWQGAYLEVITNLAIDGCISIGYARIPESKTLARDEWLERQ